ncbi:MAG TPA: coenzyme F420-0:L-glutamate ligase [Actinomycetota bacterium]|nr:coenzyme F420-0:L-glutamate ligase [Actinomycetota bacterium]
MTVEIFPVGGLAEVEPGDDLSSMLAPLLRGVGARDEDVVAVTQKIVSKAEGRLVPADERSIWLERESAAVVARRGDLVIVRTRHGFVCANAGIDASNVPPGVLSLLPDDPDASADRLREGLEAQLGLKRLGIVVTDTFGRPWREGVVDVAIGCSGLAAVLDLRGTPDDRGRGLETTIVALADAVAAAAGLVMTKRARVPAALVRGVELTPDDAPAAPARALVRRPEDDLFRISALEAVASSRSADQLTPGAVDARAVEESVTAASTAAGGEFLFVTLTSADAARELRAAVPTVRSTADAFVVVCTLPTARSGATDRGLVALGALGVALRAHELAWWWTPEASFDRARVGAALRLAPAEIVAIVAVGTAEGGA